MRFPRTTTIVPRRKFDMTAIDEIINNLRQALVGTVPIETIHQVEASIMLALENYDLVRKERALVVYESTDLEILNRFFLAKAVQGCTEKTLWQYKTNLTYCFRMMNKHIIDVTADDVRILLAKKKIDKVSDARLASLQRALSSFYNWAAAEELIEKNPMIRVEKVKVHRIPEAALTDEQMEQLRYCCKTKREKALLEFLYSTGCRISEACALNIHDIDFENEQVQVLGKGKKYRTVYLSQRCKYALKDYLDSRKDHFPALFNYDWDDMRGSGLKTLQREKYGENGYLSPDQARTIIKHLGIRAGFRVHPHLLRKTVATLALQKGMPIDEVRLMLGHESIETTTIYAQTKEETVKQSHKKYV